MSSIDYSFRWPAGPEHVVVTGEFDGWKGTVSLEKSPTTGEFEVTLPISIAADKDKIFFKFIVDGQWVTSGFYDIGSDPAGIENNYITKRELLGLGDTPSAGSDATNAGANPTPATQQSTIREQIPASEIVTKSSTVTPHNDSVPDVVVARSSKSLNVRPSAPIVQRPAASINAASSEIATSAGSAVGSSSASSATPDTTGQGGKKVRVKRRIKRNKKTGESIVVSEVRTPLSDDEGLGNTTEEEFSAAAVKIPATHAPGSVENTPTHSSTKNNPVSAVSAVAPGTANSLTSSPSSRKSHNSAVVKSSPKSTSKKERPTSVLLGSSSGSPRTNSPCRSKSGTPSTPSRKERPHSAVVESGSGSSSRNDQLSRTASSKRHSHYVDAIGVGASPLIASGAGSGAAGFGRHSTDVDQAVHILPIENETSDKENFKSIAGEPGPYLPSNQEQLENFPQVNDDIDPKAFNERLSKQFKAEHDKNGVKSKKAEEQKITKKANEKVADHGFQTQKALNDFDKEANADKLEHINKDDTIDKVKGAKSAPEGTATRHHKSHKQNKNEIKKQVQKNKSIKPSKAATDETKAETDAQSDKIIGSNDILGNDASQTQPVKDITSSEIRKDESIRKVDGDIVHKGSESKNITKGVTPGTSSHEFVDSKGKTPTKDSKKDSKKISKKDVKKDSKKDHNNDTKKDSKKDLKHTPKDASVVIGKEKEITQGTFPDLPGKEPTLHEKVKKTDTVRQKSTSIRKTKDKDHSSKKKELPNTPKKSESTKKNDSPKKKETKEDKSHKKQDSLHTLDPRVHKDSENDGEAFTAHKSHGLEGSDGEDDLYVDAVTGGTRHSVGGTASTAHATEITGISDAPNVGVNSRSPDKGSSKKTKGIKEVGSDSTKNTLRGTESTVKGSKHADHESKRKSVGADPKHVVASAEGASEGIVSTNKDDLSTVKSKDIPMAKKRISDVTGDDEIVSEKHRNSTGGVDIEETPQGLDAVKSGKSDIKHGKVAGVPSTEEIAVAQEVNTTLSGQPDPDITHVKGAKSETVPCAISDADAADIAKSNEDDTNKSKTSKTRPSKSKTAKNGHTKHRTSKTGKSSTSKAGANKITQGKDAGAAVKTEASKVENSPKKAAATTSSRKPPAQSTAAAAAKAADSADKKKKLGLWARVKRILQ
ncbi:uncharacterized protein ZBAI_00969 [Zygosaccharomyces bailii ISA1307]|nr:uncharacterized protein ZBAI_00969 [Zygosaccharomyces bailii ISA1307]